jgi:hypothetical protein
MNQRHQTVFVPPRSSSANAPAPSATTEAFLTGSQLEQHLRISASHRLHLDKLGMPNLSIGKRRRYRLSEVEAFLRTRAEQETT